MKKLVLHIDVNQTIVMCDSAQNQPLEVTLNKIIANEAWGAVVEKEGALVWRPAHDHLTIHQPAPELITYDDFIKSQLPLKTPEEEPDVEIRRVFNQEQRDKRQ
jgi:hypothetical protein